MGTAAFPIPVRRGPVPDGCLALLRWIVVGNGADPVAAAYDLVRKARAAGAVAVYDVRVESYQAGRHVGVLARGTAIRPRPPVRRIRGRPAPPTQGTPADLLG